LEGFNTKLGAIPTIIGFALSSAVLIEAVSIILKSGFIPEIFESSNTDLGEKTNPHLIEKFKPKVKGL